VGSKVYGQGEVILWWWGVAIAWGTRGMGGVSVPKTEPLGLVLASGQCGEVGLRWD
jgi:hypothetical protein